MTAIVQELFAGRTETISDKPKVEIPYVVMQAADEADVKAAVFTVIPPAIGLLVLRSVTIDERISSDSWKVTVTYDLPEPSQQDAPQPVFSFDTGGGTQHITQSRQTVARYGPASSAVLGGAIGYDGENVAGVDITVPVYSFSELHYLPDSFVTPAYKGALFNLTGTVNSAPFRLLNAGECLFLGASGTKRGQDAWEMTYKFAAQPNRTNLQIGTIAAIAKKGWEYLWVQYGDDVDPAAKVLIKKPIAVYVEQVYEYANFALLGLGP
ncbi:MAG: hypothetical protein H0V44_00245 [Planctomycetes bacterium]|nr:hypothetical protein [Planctomycetota bacterium]